MSTSSFRKVGECLYRNPSSGTYFALLKVRGKQIKKSLETSDLKEAKRKLPDVRKDLQALDLKAGKMSLEDLTKKFEKTLKRLAPDTVEGKKTILRWVREKWPGGATKSVQKVKPSEVAEFLAGLSGISAHNRALEVLRPMFKSALNDGLIAKSPMVSVSRLKRSKPIRKTPSIAEFKSIVESIRTQKYADTAEESADYVEFLGLAGLGQAEASSLEWQDVNFDKGQIITFRHKTRTGFAVPIFPQLRPLLEKRYKKAMAANNGNPPPPVSKVFSIADAKKSLAAACERLELPDYSSRAFRRMFITTALERGVDVKVIAQWQGHQDGGKLILDTYSHVRPLHSERMAALMADEPSTLPEPSPQNVAVNVPNGGVCASVSQQSLN